jgi:two-component system LytT family sensor kinase
VWAGAGLALRRAIVPPPDGTVTFHFAVSWFFTTLPFGVAVYFAVLGVEHATYYFRIVRERDTQAARLAAQLAEARLGALRMQLHPHFLFNTLQAVTTLVHDDPERAEEILVRLSHLLRVALRESEVREIPLGRELELLEHYTAIQTCRFQDRLRFDVRAAPWLLDCLVPTLLLQPLVENAVHHGVGKHKGSDTIRIGATQEGDSLRLTICNTIGSLSDTSEPKPRRGLGLAATRARLEQLYGWERSSFHLTNLEPEGVCAELVMPLHTQMEVAPLGDEAPACPSVL